ncbi:MAG: AAA family ATPase [Bdellovibrionales bacterium]|nr:AAA family ATPase [Bdellovibrionales bacterium]
MLTIHALERNAEERESLISWLQHLLHEDTPDIEFIPRVDLRPVSPDEIKFHGTPDICIVGPNILEEELTQLGKIRKLLPTTPIIAVTTARLEGLAQIEQIARLGATDTLSQSDSAATLLRKLVLLSKHKAEKKGGKLIVVDSGKGGIGVTSLAAALAEVSALEDKKTVLVDFDFETQDLSRFLQVKPYFNDNLQLLLLGQRPITQEFVEQCVVQIWEDHGGLYHLPPPADSEVLFNRKDPAFRTILSILEVLDKTFDTVFIDLAGVSGPLKRALYRSADDVIFIINNDPASLYASVDQISKATSWISPETGFKIVENFPLPIGLKSKFLRTEFLKAAGLNDNQLANKSIPYCKNAFRWPGSGISAYSHANQKFKKAIYSLLADLNLIEYKQKFSIGRIFNQNEILSTKKLKESKVFPTESAREVNPSLPTSAKLLDHLKFENNNSCEQIVLNGTPEQKEGDEQILEELNPEKLISGVSIN